MTDKITSSKTDKPGKKRKKRKMLINDGASIISKIKGYIDGGWQRNDDAIPSISNLSLYLDVARSTLYKWRDEDKDIYDLCDQIMAIQQKTLLDHGLRGTYNSNIVKLALGKHGFNERSQSDDIVDKIKTEFHIHPVQAQSTRLHDDQNC